MGRTSPPARHDPPAGRAAASTPSRRPRSSSAARCSRSARRWRRRTSARPLPRGGRLPGWRRLLQHRRLRLAAPGGQRPAWRRAGAAGAGGRASRGGWSGSAPLVLFVGTLVFAINLVDSFIGDLSPAQYDRLVWSPGHGRLRPLPRLRPPGDGRDLRQLAALLAPARPRLVDRRRQPARLGPLHGLRRRLASSAPTAT